MGQDALGFARKVGRQHVVPHDKLEDLRRAEPHRRFARVERALHVGDGLRLVRALVDRIGVDAERDRRDFALRRSTCLANKSDALRVPQIVVVGKRDPERRGRSWRLTLTGCESLAQMLVLRALPLLSDRPEAKR